MLLIYYTQHIHKTSSFSSVLSQSPHLSSTMLKSLKATLTHFYIHTYVYFAYIYVYTYTLTYIFFNGRRTDSVDREEADDFLHA